MTMQQVFVSFADGRNLSNAMDKSSETTVSMADAAHQDAAQVEPLMSSATFDFQHYQYNPPTLLQQIIIYMRIKASARHSSVALTAIVQTHTRARARCSHFRSCVSTRPC